MQQRLTDNHGDHTSKIDEMLASHERKRLQMAEDLKMYHELEMQKNNDRIDRLLEGHERARVHSQLRRAS